MAAGQRDISVSEFFAKNRHLLGFDNPRKALLTTVKEAVDNALDACEEAGILPEIWVHIDRDGPDRYKVGVQDNGPGILKKQIPLIFGKLLYGSKFHRLRMSRGQQGIGISAAGMYGLLTTGKPVKIMSKVSQREPAHYYEIQIDTKKQHARDPQRPGRRRRDPARRRGPPSHRETRYRVDRSRTRHAGDDRAGSPLPARPRQRRRVPRADRHRQPACRPPLQRSGRPRAAYARGRPSNCRPSPRRSSRIPTASSWAGWWRCSRRPRPPTLAPVPGHSFSRVSPSVARRICEAAKISTRANPNKIGRHEADLLYQAIQQTKIPAPATDCISPIGEQLILKGLRQVVPGEFYAAATRPPAVYRGNPFQIEVGLAYGGTSPAQRVARETLTELLEESDARTLRQFLITTFDGLGAEAADKILAEADVGTRVSPGRLKPAEVDRLHQALQNVNLSEGQTMTVLRYANRVPLQFQAGACAITQTVMATNWRAYGLNQSRGSLPSGPVTVMVHMASVWVPFTNESKEAIAAYPEIQKELRLALQAVGPQAGHVPPPPAAGPARRANAATSSSATWAKWPRPSAASTAPTARSSTSSFSKSPKTHRRGRRRTRRSRPGGRRRRFRPGCAHRRRRAGRKG